MISLHAFLRIKSLFLLVLELYPTTFNNKLSHDNIIEKYSNKHSKERKIMKMKRNAKLQKKKKNKSRTTQY
jgi:hypothetical protein